MTLSPCDALDEIQKILSDNDWDSDTATYIAEVMERAGYTITDTPEDDDDVHR